MEAGCHIQNGVTGGGRPYNLGVRRGSDMQDLALPVCSNVCRTGCGLPTFRHPGINLSISAKHL
jgi:hypothetical protein